jgi:hypothetical protein
LLLDATTDGPNELDGIPTRDGKGNIRVNTMSSTLLAGPGFGYLMLYISREGMQTVYGNPLPKVLSSVLRCPTSARKAANDNRIGRVSPIKDALFPACCVSRT